MPFVEEAAQLLRNLQGRSFQTRDVIHIDRRQFHTRDVP